MSLVAVKPILHSNLDLLKRDALLFDRVSIPYLPGYLRESPSEAFSQELEWLMEQGLVTETRTFGPTVLTTQIDKDELKGVWSGNLKDAALFESHIHLIQSGATGNADLHVSHGDFMRCAFILLARVGVVSLRSEGKDAVVLVDSTEPGVESDIQDNIASIVITQLPQPDESTSWESILDFRGDPEAQHSLLSLRRWLHKLASSKPSLAEAKDELQWTLEEYEQHMRLHRIKINKGLLETVITLTAEALENVAKLRLSKLAKMPFLFNNRRIDLLEAERSAPGRDVAYIWKSRQRFKAHIE